MSRKYHGGMPDTVIVEKCVICQRKGQITEEEYAGGRSYNPLDYLPSDSYSYSTSSFDINQAAEGEWFYIPHFTSYINHPISRMAAYHVAHRAMLQIDSNWELTDPPTQTKNGYELDGSLSRCVELEWIDIGPGHRAIAGEVRIRRKKPEEPEY